MTYFATEETKTLCSISNYHLSDFMDEQTKSIFPFNIETIYKAVEDDLIKETSIHAWYRRTQNKRKELHNNAQGLSNLVGQFPIKLTGLSEIKTNEHLYQAFKFDGFHSDDNTVLDEITALQDEVLAQKTAVSAKMKAKRKANQNLWFPFMENYRNGFRKKDPKEWEEEDINDATKVINLMWYSLQLKLANNKDVFASILLKNGAPDKGPIIEIVPNQDSPDQFWGVKINEDGSLTGLNIMGKLLSKLRDDYRADLLRKKEEDRDYFESLIVNPPFDLKIKGVQLIEENYN